MRWIAVLACAGVGALLHAYFCDWTTHGYVPGRDFPPPEAVLVLVERQIEEPNTALRKALEKCGETRALRRPYYLRAYTRCLRRTGYDPTELPPRSFTRVERFGIYPAHGGRGVALFAGMILPSLLLALAVALSLIRRRVATNETQPAVEP